MKIRILQALTVALVGVSTATMASETRLTWRGNPARGEGEILVNDQRIAQIDRSIDSRGTLLSLVTSELVAQVHVLEEPLEPHRPFPKKITTTGWLQNADTSVQQSYILLAPAAPIAVEGLGLEVSTDEPGQNTDEHSLLSHWLSSKGLTAGSASFEDLHLADTGRELHVWYEISGRRVKGRVSMLHSTGAERDPAYFDSLFHTTGAGWKIHHARYPWYHRESLELVDTVQGLDHSFRALELRSYQCGCYDWAIGGDWVTLGDDLLYHVTVEWENYRVGAGFFLGLTIDSAFPWLSLNERERSGDLARRAKAYQFTDAEGTLFAEISISAESDPPATGLGPETYEVSVLERGGQFRRLARIEYKDEEITVWINSPLALNKRPEHSDLELLDQLFAAMPTQVLRGDSVRDSHLGKVETMLDWVRLLWHTNAGNLSDVVSEVDGLTAIGKVSDLLQDAPGYFVPAPADMPGPAQRQSGSPYSRD
jgi:hypothetical protein